MRLLQLLSVVCLYTGVTSTSIIKIDLQRRQGWMDRHADQVVGTPPTLSRTELVVTYLGCFTNKSISLQQAHIIYTNFTANKCLEVCAGSGSLYAGVANQNETCYCGRDLPSQTVQVNDTLCNVCPGEPNRNCGGAHSLAVFQVMTVKLTDGNYSMDFLLARNHAVDLFNGSDNTYRIELHNNSDITAVDYHYQRKEGFTIMNQVLYRFPLPNDSFDPSNPSNRMHHMVAHILQCKTFALDWVHDRVFWPDCGSYASIMMADLDGYAEHSLVSLSEAPHYTVKDIAIDPYEGFLFWISGDTLMTCQLDGRGLHPVLAKLPANDVSTLSVDLAGRRIYFSGSVDGSGRLFHVNYNGDQVFRLQNDFAQTELWCFSIFRSDVYYMSHVVNNGSYLMRVPVNGTAVQAVMSVTEMVSHMKIIHPELQSPGVINACTDRGCSHHCVVKDSHAICRCPLHYSLEDDERTCTVFAEEKLHPVLTVLLGILFLVIAVLVAAVLMCLCDKLWSQIHPTSVRIANERVFHRPIIYRRGEDDNLI